MFLDDTACNLASANLLQFYDRDGQGASTSQSYEHACRLWTVVLEISVMMAQFPSKEIAELSYEYRTLGLGYANIGGLLMTMGLPYDSDAGPRARRRAHRDHDRRRPMRPRPRWRASSAPSRATRRTPSTCCASSATTAAPPMAWPRAMRASRSRPVPLDHASLPRRHERSCRARQARLGPGARARREARLPQRAGDRHRADRHDRPRHGLRHHRHRARLRAGEVQEARRRRLLQDHQPRRAGRAARARLPRSEIAEIEAYAVGHGTLAPGARRSTTRTLARQGLHARRRSTRSRRA